MDKTMKKQSSLLLISSCLLQAVLFSGGAGTAHGFGAPAAGTGTPAKTDSFAWSAADNGGDFPSGRMLQGIEVQPKRDVLSPEAKTMAAYLTMLQAVSTGHEEAGIAAAEELSNVTRTLFLKICGLSARSGTWIANRSTPSPFSAAHAKPARTASPFYLPSQKP